MVTTSGKLASDPCGPQSSHSNVPAEQRGQLLSRRLLVLAEAARLLGLSVASTRRLIAAGKLPAVRLTRRIHVEARDVERLIEQSKQRACW